MVFDLCCSLGFFPSISRREHPDKTRRYKDLYLVNIHGNESCNSILGGKVISEKNTSEYVFYRVEEMEKEPFSGTVYDLTIEGDHSYSTYNCTYHNSQANRMRYLSNLGANVPTLPTQSQFNIIPTF